MKDEGKPKRKRTGPKPGGKVVRERRRSDVEAYLAMGVPYPEIVTQICAKHDVTSNMVYVDIRMILKRWEEESGNQRPHRRNQMREMLRRIVRKATVDRNHGAAVAAATRLMELDGLRQLKVESTTGPLSQVDGRTSAEKRKRLEELVAIANARRMASAMQIEGGGTNGQSHPALGSGPVIDVGGKVDGEDDGDPAVN